MKFYQISFQGGLINLAWGTKMKHKNDAFPSSTFQKIPSLIRSTDVVGFNNSSRVDCRCEWNSIKSQWTSHFQGWLLTNPACEFDHHPGWTFQDNSSVIRSTPLATHVVGFDNSSHVSTVAVNENLSNLSRPGHIILANLTNPELWAVNEVEKGRNGLDYDYVLEGAWFSRLDFSR